MSFLQEKQSKYYFLFTTIFCVFLLSFSVLLRAVYGQNSKKILINAEQAIASSLIEQGVPVEMIATAFTNTNITSEGTLFLQQINQTQETPIRFFPIISQASNSNFAFTLFFMLIFSIVLLIGSALFLIKRENLYLKANLIIRKFANGSFQEHLPRNKTGSLYQLFTSVDQLAMALESKSEAERKSKEFLKDTISDISHQLKTPLTALNMYTEIIRGESENVKVVQEFSQKSLLSLARMEQLIQSLLKVMRLDAGSITFIKKTCNVEAVVEQAISELLTRAELEGKQIILDGDPKEIMYCDFQWTREAIGNLVKNALDHTQSNGMIEISWQRSPAMLRLFVKDNGCGIAPEDIHHVFKRFYRSKQSSDTQGVGLGLSLAKSIIVEQGGLLSVQSTLDIGTTFIISFPAHIDY